MRFSLCLLVVVITAGPCLATVPDNVLRPRFGNASGVNESGGLTISQGIIARGTSGLPSNSDPDNPLSESHPTFYLSEAQYGHPFANLQDFAPNRSFAEKILRNDAGTGVYDVLYPPGYRTPTGVTASRTEMDELSEGGAFRYKWLAFGEDGQDADGNPIVLSLFADLFGETPDENNPWFGDAERQLARDQIEVLREALAIAPLNRELQLALLDIYYDLAAAEMQFVNKRLSRLAIIRLGLDSTPSNFIIDDEINIYREMLQVVGQAAAWYSELLCFEMSGVEPGDFAPAFEGFPYGQFLFRSRVPGRSQTATELVNSPTIPRVATADDFVATFELPGENNDFTITAVAPAPKNFRVVMLEGSTVPSFGVSTLVIPIDHNTTTITQIKAAVEAVQVGGISLFTVSNLPGNNGSGTASIQAGVVDSIIDPDPDNDIVFAGYKDFQTFITILGQLVQYKCDLARLLGLRQAAGDLTEARQLLAEVQGPDSDTYKQLLNLFPNTDFDDVKLDATGVRAAFTLFKTALSDCVGVRSFINGTTNMLGLDPNFILLVQKNQSQLGSDSYDILAERINRVQQNGTPVGALAVALDELGDPDRPTGGGGAIQAFNTFSSSVSDVAGDLLDLEIQFRNRFEEITGFEWNGGDNDWDGGTPKPGVQGSDLATINRTIDRLNGENTTLGQIVAKGDEDVIAANNAVSLAEGIKDSILDAESAYFDKTTGLWIGLGITNAISEAAHIAQNTVNALSGVDGLPPVAAIKGAAVTKAGVANGIAQAAAVASRTALESQFDAASIQYNTKLALADQSLTVQQNALAIGALEREVLSNQLQINSNSNALAQAQADKAALLREVARIEENFEDSRASLASSYFADPIHFQRAEASLLIADASFRRAQLWLFMTCRALEYKWQERFSYANPQIGESLDIGSIFKSRNALELERIFQNMEFFNDDRELQPGTRRDDLATVSLRDRVLTPNPKDVNKEFGAFPLDDGIRSSGSSSNPIDKVSKFQEILAELQTAPGNSFGSNGPITIPIDTTQLEIGQLFAGPRYTYSPPGSTNLTSITSGLYRDKITYLAVHFVFKEGSLVKGNLAPSIPGNNGIDGDMTYAGNTFFRTRIPPYPSNLATGTPQNTSDNSIVDSENGGTQPRTNFPGEFLIAPFRYFQNTDPATRQFETFDNQQAPSLEYLFSTQSAETPAVETAITNASGFQIRDFQELSVATTRLELSIAANQFKIEDLIDIEILVQHTAYVRPQVALPSN